ncbi:MAG TPA: NUDIX domain-containing protein [Anaerolineae bacterium]
MSSKPFALSIKVVIFDRARRCLVLKRSTKSKVNMGKWDFPGGKAEPGEKFDQALLREVKEETALKISLQHFAGGAESETPTRRVICLIMQARIKSGKVRLSDEHDDYAWVNLRDLTKVDLAPQFKAFAKAYSRGNR